MNELIITKGLPGSGKSTWAKEFCIKNKDYVRVSRDDLRNMRGQYWLPKDEDLITDWEHTMIALAFQNKKKVVLDATNLKMHCDVAIGKMLRAKGFNDVMIKIESFLDVSVEECIKRDLKRNNSVGEEVIRGMHERYVSPPATYKESTSLRRAVIVDIDGTLAKMAGRGPFEWNKVGTDLLNTNVTNLVRSIYHAGTAVILMSGRDGSCRDLTVEWLDKHTIQFHALFMRPAGNNEKDSIIKKRLFEDNIRGQYYVDFVLDDRDQVVRMWRKELGLTCLQVDYGNF